MIKFDFQTTLDSFDQNRVNSARDLFNGIRKEFDSNIIGSGWVDKYINSTIPKEKLLLLMEKAAMIQKNSSTLIVLCESTVGLAIKSLVDPLKSGMSEILFLGDSLSAYSLFDVLEKVRDKSVYLYVISDDLDKPEIGSHFRVLRQWIEKNYRHDEVTQRIIVVSREESELFNIAKEAGYMTLTYEKDFPLEYIIFHPVSYLPLYVCGIELQKFFNGATKMIKEYTENKEHCLIDYIVVRWLALQEGIEVENVCTFEPKLESFCQWRSRLKGNDMLYHGSALYIRDLDMLKYYNHRYMNKMMETFINITVPNIDIVVRPDLNFKDGQDKLNNISFNQLNNIRCDDIIEDHRKEGIFINEVHCKRISAEILGALFIFFILAGLGVNLIIEKYSDK